MSYAFKLAGIAIALLIGFLIAIALFGKLWVQLGLVAAIVVICIPLLAVAWYVDRKEKRQREGLEEI